MSETVGILSMQRVVNYGSVLQAWALRQMLHRAGAEDVSFIDIRPGRPIPGYDYSTAGRYARRFEELLRLTAHGRLGPAIRDRQFNRELRRQFEDTFFPMLDLSDHREVYDLTVIGSDEVFNCCQSTPWGFTTQLYGDIPNARRVISYAASFGNTTFGDLERLGLGREISDSLKKLGTISVRDQNSKEIIKNLTGQEAFIHPDPVLIYDFEKESAEKTVSESGFLLIYSYPGRIHDPKEIEAIREFAWSKRLKLYSLMCRYDWCDKAVMPADPFEVLAWFRAADYVVTDTFHGTILSVKAAARFGTLIRPSNMNKLQFLLTTLGLETRQIVDADSLDRILPAPVDYRPVNDYISESSVIAEKYLSDALKAIKR